MRFPTFLSLIGFAVLTIQPATAQEPEWHSTASLIGESKYGDDFERYDYVNPDAPKGGTLNSTTTGTFDSFNPYVIRGSAAAGFAVRGFGGGLLYDTLMQQAIDEPSTSHALIAEAYSNPDDYSSATYRINPKARWHDGEPITAEDVVWSFNVLKENSQLYNRYYENVTEAVAVNDHEVKFNFDQTGNRELPHIMGDLAVLPKHWFEGEDASGKKRDISQPTLEAPLGSGAYRVESFDPGARISWKRVEDYWGADLPVNVGRNNFDRLTYTYFLDDNAEFLAFKKGGIEDIRREVSTRRWSSEYDFPAVQAGDVIKREFESGTIQGMQAFVFNTRRDVFKDHFVREALAHAFDFEWSNRTLFYGQYSRTRSYFDNSELAATGVPKGDEGKLLEAYRGRIPDEVFSQEYNPPKTDSSGNIRRNLRKAIKLLNDAGWVVKDRRRVNEKTGMALEFEVLLVSPLFERIVLPFAKNLEKLGVKLNVRTVDPSQYRRRLDTFDFDVIVSGAGQSLSPGNEQRLYWGSAMVGENGSRNWMGVESEAVDGLIEEMLTADSQEDFQAATKALDRVLTAGRYVIPIWYSDVSRVAHVKELHYPETLPMYGDWLGFQPELWWYEE